MLFLFTNDDFFLDDYMYLEKCDSLKAILKSDIVLPIGAIFSILCYLYLFHMYFIKKSPILMRHPTTLAIYRCIFEFVFVQQYTWVPFLNNDVFYQPASITNNTCVASTAAAVLSFVSQFALLGGELWFFVISWDLRLAATNPFSSYKLNKRYYTLLVFSIAFTTSWLLILWGPQAYGVASEGVIWIQNRRSEYDSKHPNVCKFFLFYIWMFAIYLYCVWACYMLTIQMRKGFAETLASKLSIIQRARIYVIGYTIFWSVLLSFEFISYIFNRSTVANILTTGVSYGFCFRGVWSLGIILYTNRADLSWDTLSPFRSTKNQRKLVEKVVNEGLLLKPHLNTALRSEVLYFTTQGIMYAARECEKHNFNFDRNIFQQQDDDINLNNQFGVSELTNGTNNEPREYSFVDRLSYMIKIDNQPKSRTLIKSIPLFQNDATTRDTFSNIAKINELQQLAINKEKIIDFESEIENLGLLDEFDDEGNNSMIESKDSNTIDDINIKNKDIESNLYQSYHHDSDISENDINLQDKNNSISTTSETNSNNDKPIDISNIPKNNKLTKEIIDEINNKSNTTSPLHMLGARVSASDSITSDTTLRWRDTMDIEFQFSNIVPDKKNSTSIDSISTWQRIRGKRKNSSNVNNNNRNISYDIRSSNSSDSNHSIQAISKAVASVFISAKDIAMNIIKQSHYQDFKFKDFSPLLFAKIRAANNISTEEYADSFLTTTNETFSEGRSGAFMFFSSNQKFIVKTTNKQEIIVLQRILPKLYTYFCNNKNSLILKFYGAHCITMYGQQIYFIVMGNVFPTTTLSERYDLKGSWVNRHRTITKRNIIKKGKQKRMKDSLENSAPLLFDNDVRQRITLLPTVANALAEQIRRDVTFLRDQGLMDYSLLVGVKRQKFEVIRGSNSLTSTNNSFTSNITLESDNPFQRKKDGGISASIVEGPGTFYFGIIDVLQEWNYVKKLERFFKIIFLRLEGDGLSAIAPDLYAARFYEGAVLDFLEGIENNTNYFLSNKRKPYRRSIPTSTPILPSNNESNETNDRETAVTFRQLESSSNISLDNSLRVEINSKRRDTVRLLHNDL